LNGRKEKEGIEGGKGGGGDLSKNTQGENELNLKVSSYSQKGPRFRSLKKWGGIRKKKLGQDLLEVFIKKGKDFY